MRAAGAISGAYHRLTRFVSSNKISAVVALVSTIIGVSIGGIQLGQRVQEIRTTRAEVRRALSVGDQYAEHDDYRSAAEEYQKALTVDHENVEAHRRLVVAMRKEVDLETPVWRESEEGQSHIKAALRLLYELRTIRPGLKNDRPLLLEEALLLSYGNDNMDGAIDVLEKARRLHPDDPETLATLGFFEAMDSSGQRAQALELIRRAIAIRPQDATYHYYLAQSLDKAGRDADAIGEYRRSAELASGVDIWSQRTRNDALENLFQVFNRYSDAPGGVLTAQLALPLEERARALEYYLANYSTTRDQPHYLLADLYHALGKEDKANIEIRKALGNDPTDWRYHIPMVELLVRILEKGPADDVTLAKARKVLGEAQDKARYDEILEIGNEKERMFKVGLRVDKQRSVDGVYIERVFQDYPFQKAGVRHGDAILEFAHRKVGTLRDIWLTLIEFEPGTDVPVEVRRGNNTLHLKLIVE